MNREEILRSLLNFTSPMYLVKSELSKYVWDSNKEYVVVDRGVILHALNMFLTNQINSELLEEWANIIECRDDIGFENEQLKELIFELANPILHGRLTEHKAQEIMLSLSQSDNTQSNSVVE